MKQMKPILMILALLLLSEPMYAQVAGILKGRVVDEEDKPLIGATVKVEGTIRGDKTKNGRFTIANIPAGKYNVITSYVGLLTDTTKVTISANQTTEINVKLSAKATMTKELIVFGDIPVDEKKIGTSTTMSTDDLRSTAANGVNAMVATSAGVTTSGAGFSIRGARPEDTQVKIDGLEVGNQFTGGYGVGGTAYYPMVSSLGTEEVQVITGGMSAEYGSAMGGVVNTVAKRGRTNAYEIAMNYRTDLSALNGSQSDGVRVYRDGVGLYAEDFGDGAKLQGKNEHLFEFGFGGPLHLIENSTFYISGYNRTEQFRSASYEIYDPIGNNLGQMPNSQAWVKNIQGRVMLPVSEAISLNLGGSWGLSNWESSGSNWLYSNDQGIVNGVANGMAERIAKQPVVNQFVTTFFAKINHALSNSSFYEIQFSYSVNNDEIARRKTADDPSFFGGFEVYTPEDSYRYVGNDWRANSNDSVDYAIDIYQSAESKTITEDGMVAPFQRPMLNPITGYYEGQGYSQGTDNAWGIPFFFTSHGNNSGIEYRYGNYMQVDGNYTSDFELGDFAHTFKAGFEFRTYNMQRHNNGTPWLGLASYDIYSDKFGGNIYSSNLEEKEATGKAQKPWRASAFVQDQIKFKGLVFTPGLRVELFNPNAKYRKNLERFVPVSEQINDSTGVWGESEMKVMVSPRINVTYPITATSNFSMNYGIYYKMPELQSMYDGINVEQLLGASTLGNSNVKPQRTNDYQISYNALLPSDLTMSVSAYYKDIYNQFGYVYVKVVPTPFWMAEVSEYGNNKGLEFEISRSLKDNYGFRFNYTLAQVTGTANAQGSNLSLAPDPYQTAEVIVLPLAPYNLGRDVRHRVNAIFDLAIYDDEGPQVFDTYIFDNMRFNVSGNYRSGVPYTLSGADGTQLSERNALRGPSFWTANLKVSKRFMMKDYFGEDMGSSSLEIYFDVFNFLNNTDAAGVYGVSSDPLDDGVSLKRQIGTFQDVDWYAEGSWGRPSSVDASQYDYYGNRKYNKQADFDKNGVVTQQEVYNSYINYIENQLKFRGNYQAPRTVMFGIQFSFN